MRSEGEGAPPDGRFRFAVLGGLLAVAALLRVLGAVDSLWLDEIWSLRLADQAESALQVFTSLHHDNNHYLNTLWMRALGPGAAWIAYRAPAVAAGIGTVLLAGWVEWRAGLWEGVLAASTFAVSYPFVHYASEARGYGPVVFLSLAAFALLLRVHRTGDTRSVVLFAVVSALGFLAHLTFLTVYLPLLAWSLWTTLARRDAPSRAAPVMAAHLVPLVVITFLILVDVRYLVRGGGPELLPVSGWLGSWRYALGIPTGGPLAVGLGATFLIALLTGFREQARQHDGVWVFFVLVLVFPVALLLVLRTGYAPPRYFLASLAFGLLLVSRGTASLLRGGLAPRLAAVALIVVFVVGNGWRTAKFLAQGRGEYRAVVRYMATHTSGDTVRVASDYDFGSSMVLGYYERYLSDSRVLEYLARGDGHEEPSRWFLVHELDDEFNPPEVLQPREHPAVGGGRYVLRRLFPKYGLSGWNWAVYEREAPPE